MMHDLDRVIVDLSACADYLSEISVLLQIAQDYLGIPERTSHLKTKVVVDEAAVRLDGITKELRYYHQVMVATLALFAAAVQSGEAMLPTGDSDRSQQ